MAGYQKLEERLNAGDVIILDGAIGTELQAMGAPMDEQSWAGTPNLTHPNTVLQMHINYIRAGADVITTNTYSTARHNLEPLGHGDLTFELNTRAVHLAQEAIWRANVDRPVYIAGAVSSFGLLTGGEYGNLRHRFTREGRAVMSGLGFLRRGAITAEQSKDNLKEQADLLAEAGVDFMLAECTDSLEQRRWISEAVASVGLPMWTGFKVHSSEDDQGMSKDNLKEQADLLAEAGVDFMLAECTDSLEQRRWISEAVASVGLPMWTGFKVHSSEDDQGIRTGYRGEEPFEQVLEEIIPMGGSVMTVFHSLVDETDAAISILKQCWDGPIAAYPESGRRDYVARFNDGSPNEMDPQGYLEMARKWVSEGVQVIGGCCGMGLDYIEPLREGLPTRLEEARSTPLG